MEKTAIRSLIRQRKAAYSLEERTALSRALCDELSNNQHVTRSHVILSYHPLSDETDLRPLMTSLNSRPEPPLILLPVVVGNDIELREYEGEATLREGAFHILEPTGKVFTDYDTIDTALIPGIAFTAEGDRLGRGKGYYDRLLSRMPHTYKIGICWPFQLVDAIPHEEHDIRMNQINTMR